jgi:hypothetical protein
MNNSVAAADLNLSKRRVALRLTTLAWAVLAFYFSTERFGSNFSQGLVAQALTLLHIKRFTQNVPYFGHSPAEDCPHDGVWNPGLSRLW